MIKTYSPKPAELTHDWYSVEYAEGSAGTDIAHHLQVAGRALRAAHAIHEQNRQKE